MQVTTKQLMDGSKVFRFLFWGSIVCVAVGIVLSIVFPFTTCYNLSKHSCNWDYGSAYPFECKASSVTFCCNYGYNACGNSAYCRIKPSYYGPCDGVIIAAWSLMGTGLFIAIFVFVLFCKYRQQVRQGKYANLGANPLIAPNYGSPVIVYPGQQNYQGEAAMARERINFSENQ